MAADIANSTETQSHSHNTINNRMGNVMTMATTARQLVRRIRRLFNVIKNFALMVESPVQATSMTLAQRVSNTVFMCRALTLPAAFARHRLISVLHGIKAGCPSDVVRCRKLADRSAVRTPLAQNLQLFGGELRLAA
jgi:hypothetical protein